MPQTPRVLRGNYTGAVERAKKTSIVSADRLAKALRTTLAALAGLSSWGRGYTDPGGFLPASEAMYPVAYKSHRDTLG